MTSKFFSREISWQRVWFASFITTLISFVVAFLLWYFFLYVPLAARLAESQKLDAEMKQLNELKGTPPAATPAQQ